MLARSEQHSRRIRLTIGVLARIRGSALSGAAERETKNISVLSFNQTLMAHTCILGHRTMKVNKIISAANSSEGD